MSSTGASGASAGRGGSNVDASKANGAPQSLPSPTVGTEIEVFWSPDDKFYPGTVVKVFKKSNKHQVQYDDGDIEKLDLAKERWRLKQGPTEPGNGTTNKAGEDDNEGNTVPEVKPNPSGAPQVGATIQVYWPDDKEYYEGIIKSFNKKTKKHQIDYEDGQSEKLVLDEESWRYPPASGNTADEEDEGASDEEDEGASDEEEKEEKDQVEVKVGDRIEVYWPDDDVYYSGTINKFDKKTNKHLVKYDDNEEENLVLKKEKWRFVKPSKDANTKDGKKVAQGGTTVAKKRGRPAKATKAESKPVGGKARKKKRT